MTTLTLVVSNPKVKRTKPASSKALLTPEMLYQKVMHLPLGDSRIGQVLSDAIHAFEVDAPDALSRSSDLSNLLRSVGVTLCLWLEDGDPPSYGVIEYPDRFVKAYPDMASYKERIDCLELARRDVKQNSA